MNSPSSKKSFLLLISALLCAAISIGLAIKVQYEYQSSVQKKYNNIAQSYLGMKAGQDDVLRLELIAEKNFVFLSDVLFVSEYYDVLMKNTLSEKKRKNIASQRELDLLDYVSGIVKHGDSGQEFVRMSEANLFASGFAFVSIYLMFLFFFKKKKVKMMKLIVKKIWVALQKR